MTDAPTLCLLHIGKTGGTYLRSILRHNRQNWTRPIQLLRHSATLMNTLESFGEDRQLAFTFRDPTERFVSAFYSRQRQGRPTYQFNWSAAEAAAFQWFDSAENLALALNAPDERQKSAAYFAFDAIEHLKSNLGVFLQNVQTLRLSRPQIVMCADISELDTYLPEVMERMGVPQFKLPSTTKRHAAPSPLPKLSPEAEAALKAYWAEEYELYDVCRAMARDLGLSG